MQPDPTPPHIAALLGKRVRVSSPNDSSRWEGRLISYAPDPSVIIERDDSLLGSRVCLPASYDIAGAPAPPTQPCPSCSGSGSVPARPPGVKTAAGDRQPPLRRGSDCPVHGGTLLWLGDGYLTCLHGHGYRIPDAPPPAGPSRRSARRL